MNYDCGSPMKQLGIFDVLEALPEGSFSNSDMYSNVASKFNFDSNQTELKKNGIKTWKRSMRYALQTLKLKGLVERVGNDEWVRTGSNNEFRTMIGSSCVLAYSTDYGVAVWGDAKAAAEIIDEPVNVILSSPPYPLQVQRNYGQAPHDEQKYVDWLCSSLEPIIGKLADGGSIALNLGNDIFCKGSPERSTYKERLTLELKARFGLQFMDNIIWSSNKAPGPIKWAQRESIQLYTSYENILWFTNNAESCRTDNTRISSLGTSINRNLWAISNNCKSGRELHRLAKKHGLPKHQALMPLALAKTAVEFFSKPNDLLFDPFSGGNTVGLACEELKRRWFASDIHYEILKLSKLRF
jgi:DNA modification methylase